jgi:hypothetical protein
MAYYDRLLNSMMELIQDTMRIMKVDGLSEAVEELSVWPTPVAACGQRPVARVRAPVRDGERACASMVLGNKIRRLWRGVRAVRGCARLYGPLGALGEASAQRMGCGGEKVRRCRG